MKTQKQLKLALKTDIES